MCKGLWFVVVMLACGRTQTNATPASGGMSSAGARAAGGVMAAQGGALGSGGALPQGEGGALGSGGASLQGEGGVLGSGGASPQGEGGASGEASSGRAGDDGGAGASGGEGGVLVDSASCAPVASEPSLAFFGLWLDWDEDGLRDVDDNCPVAKNPGQRDTDGDGLGDACDACSGLDSDADGVCDPLDVCPSVWDPAQSDIDGRAPGDACDEGSNACAALGGMAEAERALMRAVSDARVSVPLANARWRWLSTRTYCLSEDRPGRAISLLIYAPRNPVLSVVLHGDEVFSVSEREYGPQDPAPSPEEIREAMWLAAQDPFVAEQLARGGLTTSGFFHFDEGEFPSCAIGRCVEVLYDRGGNHEFRAVVDLSECSMLGVLGPP